MRVSGLAQGAGAGSRRRVRPSRVPAKPFRSHALVSLRNLSTYSPASKSGEGLKLGCVGSYKYRMRRRGSSSVAASVEPAAPVLPLYQDWSFWPIPVQIGERMGSSHVESRISSGRTEMLSPDSVINLDHGDPRLYESFWRTMGEKSEIVIPGWQTTSYFSDVRNVCWFMEPEFANEVSRLHEMVGNALTEGRHIIVGTGSTQLFQAALYALSPPDGPEPMNVVASVPYYSSYPAITDFLKSGLYKWAGDATTYHVDSPYIELVTAPNNPDGLLNQAVLNRDGGKTIHDLAYYWPQYTPITAPADFDITLFTLSKSTGHAGTRIGWAIVKELPVARRMAKFIELTTIGVSKDSQLRAAKILRTVREGYEEGPGSGDEGRLFDYGRRIMTERWERLREAVQKNPIFSLPEFPTAFCNFAKEMRTSHPAFAWLKCDAAEVDDCGRFLNSHNILTRTGSMFGADPRYVRVSMVDRDEVFNILVDRLATIG